jgi:DNA polymerase-3 subunit gamma/tau
MARMLAQHAELTRFGADAVTLRVPEMHRHLLEKPYREKLQAALEERFRRRLRVEFEVGDSGGRTPAEVEDRERQSRLKQAVESIDRDPFVRELVEGFDARVVDESIRPVGPELRKG